MKLMKKLPTLMLLFCVAVFFGLYIFIFTAQKAVMPKVPQEVLTQIDDFTVEGLFGDGFLYHKFTLDKGEINNTFAPGGVRIDYSREYIINNIFTLTDENARKTAKVEKTYENTIEYTANAQSGDVFIRAGNRSMQRVNINTGMKYILKDNQRFVTRRHSMDTVVSDFSIDPFTRVNNEASLVKFNNEEYVTVSTNESITGDSGIWKITKWEDYNADNSDLTSKMPDGCEYNNTSITAGSAEKVFNFPRGEKGCETFLLYPFTNSLALFTYENNDVYVTLLDNNANVTDKQLIANVSDLTYDDFLGVKLYQTQKNDILSLAFVNGGGSEYKYIASIKVNDGKIENSLGFDIEYEKSDISLEGIYMSNSGDKVLLIQNEYLSTEVKTIFTVYENKAKIFSQSFNFGNIESKSIVTVGLKHFILNEADASKGMSRADSFNIRTIAIKTQDGVEANAEN